MTLKIKEVFEQGEEAFKDELHKKAVLLQKETTLDNWNIYEALVREVITDWKCQFDCLLNHQYCLVTYIFPFIEYRGFLFKETELRTELQQISVDQSQGNSKPVKGLCLKSFLFF